MGQGSGQALYFDNTDDYLAVPDIINNGDFTIEFWMYSNSATFSDPLMDLSYASTLASTKYFFIDAAQNSLRFHFEDEFDADVQISATVSLAANTWYHVAATGGYNRTDLHTLYLNGEVVGTSDVDFANKPDSLGSGIYFGRNQRPTMVRQGVFDGAIDEIRIWSDIRTQTEIRDHMCIQLTGSEANLAAYYTIDSGTTAAAGVADDSGNGNDASTTNMASTGIATSGAPLGDSHQFVYSATTSSSSLALASSDGDDVTLTIDAGIANAIYLYLCEEQPNTTTPASGQQQLSQEHYFGVWVSNGSGLSYTTTYNYDGHPGITTESDLELALRDNNADGSWAAGTGAVLNTTANTLTLAGQSATQELILASADAGSTLPIQLMSFTAEAVDRNVRLHWETATELNNEFFTVERSPDGNVWVAIETLDGGRTTSTNRTYSYVDSKPLLGQAYYRLRQTDFDGTYTLSAVRAVEIARVAEPALFPTVTRTNVQVQGSPSHLENIHVYSLGGQEVTNLTVRYSVSDTQIKLDLSRLAAGAYIVKCPGYSSRVIKQ